MIKQHPLIRTLFDLKGNSRACVFTEPMFGIPFNLYAPFASIYMYTLGVTDRQIGLITSIGLFVQILFALLGGVITDKLGRRHTTAIFDFLCWSVPLLIWAFSRNFTHFLIGTLFNSVQRVSMNSWNCLLVEDSDKKQIVNIYTWIYIAALGTALISPLSGFLVGKFSLVPAMRAFYLFAFVMLTAKIIILYIFSTETKQGLVRLEETKHENAFKLLSGYGSVLKQILTTPGTMLTLGIMLIMSIVNMVNGTFWPLLLKENLHISEKAIGIFPFIRSAIMLLFFFTIVPKIHVSRFKLPLLFGFCIFILGQLLLIFTHERGYMQLVISIIMETSSLALINPLLDSMQVILVDPQERARIIALLYVVVLAFTSPFGWIAGTLSSIDRRFPFMMNILLLIAGIALTYFASRVSRKKASLSS